MNTGEDNRRSFRISEDVFLKYELLTDEEFHDGLDRRKLKLGTDDAAQSKLVDIEARLSEAMYRLTSESEHVGRCITLINDKLNIAIDMLPGLRKTRATLAQMPPQTADVGADGMVFASAENLAVGTKLYVQFLLSTDNRYVETFAHVVRQTDSPDQSDSQLPYGIAIEFHGMKSAQREILIQHMFSRESETLRMRRLEIDAAEMG